jgi:hypothetical protein
MAGFCIVSFIDIDHCQHDDCLALYKNSKNKSCEIVTNGMSNARPCGSDGNDG